MTTSSQRTAAVRRALSRITRLSPSVSELELLTQYALGAQSLAQTNKLLGALGRRLRLPTEAGVLTA